MKRMPSYIEKADVAGAPISFKWLGPSSHEGPEEGTRLHDAIESLTYCGAVALGAALEEWAAWRFKGKVDLERYLAQADAARAWTVHPAYLKEFGEEEVEDPPARSAMSSMAVSMQLTLKEDDWMFPAEPAIYVVNVAFLVRYVMPKEKRKAFESWMKWALARLAKVSPRPKKRVRELEDYESEAAYAKALAPFRGDPLPPEFFAPDFDYRPELREELVDTFLQSLDWKKNPYLRSPAEMRKRGFKGTPYRLG